MQPHGRHRSRAFRFVGPLTAGAVLLAACGMRSALEEANPDDNVGVPGDGSGGAGFVNGSGGAAQPGSVRGTGGTTGKSGSGGLPGSGGRPGAGGLPGSGGRSLVGGQPLLGGSPNSGGIPSRGGAPGMGGGPPADARPLTGGMPGTGGRPGAGGSTAVRDATPDGDARYSGEVATPPPPKIDPNSGYATVNAGTVVLSGYVVSSAGGSGSSITLSCTTSSFCASGTVGASSTYKSWANASFNVNQAQSGGSGATSSLPFVGSGITVSYVDKGGSTLELQLWDGSNFWCYFLPPSTSPTTINVPFSKLNTACWDGSGTAFVSGTPVVAVQLAVPGSGANSTPFDYCFLGMTIQ
jgi:hypothetical protein